MDQLLAMGMIDDHERGGLLTPIERQMWCVIVRGVRGVRGPDPLADRSVRTCPALIPCRLAFSFFVTGALSDESAGPPARPYCSHRPLPSALPLLTSLGSSLLATPK